MSIKKYSFITIFLYGLALFSPYVWRSLGLFQTGYAPINATTVVYIVMAGILIFIYLKQKDADPLSFEKRRFPVWAIVGIGFLAIYGALLLQGAIVSIEMYFSGELPVSQNTQDILSIIRASPLFLIAVGIAGPIMEEFAFRRAMIGIIERYTNFWIGAVASSLIFAFAHADGHLLLYFSLAMFFSLLYRFTGSIWTSVITHASMNTLVVFAQLFLAQ